MRFTKPFWAGITDGSITMAFRRWRTPTVVEGRIYRTGGGRIEVLSVSPVQITDIKKTHATKAGYTSVDELIEQLPGDPDRTLYRVTFRHLDEPDPREVLANTTDLTDDDLETITKRLQRFDKASSFGPWTHDTLRLVAKNPARRAPDLAEMIGRETKPFKLDVRKLKNLGLTHSLKIGYQLSPRGQAYLDRLNE